MMKPLLLSFALFGTAIAIQPAQADTVYHGARGTAVRGPNGAAVHAHGSYGYGDPYWHTHKVGYYNGQYGHWTTTGGRHVFVVQ
jgi:hypothetical protein